MTPDRFQTLADAFGGVIARWPADLHDEAYAFTARFPDQSAAILSEARGLDEQLDEAPRLSPSHALRRTLLEAAPAVRGGHRAFQRWLAGAGVGIGLVTAACAGVVLGIDLTAASAGEDAALLAAAYGPDLPVYGDDAS